ncbi:MAG: hypothetical protein HYV77_03320 [Candidatus Wildermuthbacteria bacterium]|nr:hypothetical protein [Candidatus Wildermuthbacteria bacterium]
MTLLENFLLFRGRHCVPPIGFAPVVARQSEPACLKVEGSKSLAILVFALPKEFLLYWKCTQRLVAYFNGRLSQFERSS